MKIKLVEKGFETYTGLLGEIEFEDGVSVYDLNSRDIAMIAGSIRAETVDGSSAVGVTQDMLDRHSDEAEVIEPMQTQAEVDARAEAGEQEASETQVPEAPVEGGEGELAHYTEETLTKVADEGGIQGLREIAEGFGVKGNSIAKLIEDILAAQAKVAPKAE